LSKFLLYLLGFMAITSLHFMFKLLSSTYTKKDIDKIIDDVKTITEDEIHK